MAVTYFDATDKVTRANVNTKIDEINDSIKAVLLYNNTSGTNATITLSDSAANYEFFDIYYGYDTNVYASSRLYLPHQKYISLSEIVSNNVDNTHKYYIRASRIYIDGTTITFTQDCSLSFAAKKTSNTSQEITAFNDSKVNKIRRVIGYKKQ